MKRLEFLGDTLNQVRDFPEGARKEAGVQLHKGQQTAKRDLDLARLRLGEI